jgi:excisionase family DNA binding protein
MNGRLLTVDQVAEYLRVHRDTVFNLIRSGRLKALQLGGRKAGWRLTEEDVAAFVAERKAETEKNRSDGHELEDFDRRQAEEREAFQTMQRGQRDAFVKRTDGDK